MTDVTRLEMVKILKRRCDLTEDKAVAVVNELFGEVHTGNALVSPGLIHEAVSRGMTVDLRGFGRFERRLRKRRRITPPPGQKEAPIMPAKYVPYFKVYGTFTNLVSEAEQPPEEE